MAGRRPCFDDIGPAERAPMRPPMVKTEDMVAKVASDMGIQSGNQGDWELACLLCEGLTEANQLAALARRATPMDFFWQVTTSCGALSSAWRVWLGNASASRFLKCVIVGEEGFRLFGTSRGRSYVPGDIQIGGVQESR
jgi:hypothetical protein